MRKINRKIQNRSLYLKLLFSTLILGVLGIIAIADASSPLALREFADKYYFAKQQLYWFGIGIFLLFLFSNLRYQLWKKFATPIFLVSILLLILVLIPGIGVRLLGAKRWFILGPISVQPSEIVKFSLVLYLARLSEKNKKPLAFFLPIFLISFLIMLQPDLGTTLIILSIGFTQIFLSGINFIYLIFTIAISAVASLFLIITSDYRRERLLTYINQTEDPLGRSYHIRQVILALGSGGLLGVGLGESRQKHLFLPETATDSIFAIIAEELGFLGSLVLLFTFMFLILVLIRITQNAPDKFSQVFAGGVMAWIATQTILNLSSMVALVPLTGIPLPFFSYGGSSLIMILSSIGILLNISKTKK